MACRRAPLTPEQMHAAWVQRRRADWPASYEAAMADPLLQRLVRCMAMGMVQAQARVQARPQAGPRHPAARATGRAAMAYLHPTQATNHPAAPAAVPPQGLDRKRLAAGERDDD